jgi:hypothetical protein
MDGELFESLELANGLTLEIWNLSRLVAGDRWLVSLEVRIELPLDTSYLESVLEKEKEFSLIKQLLGPTVTYSYKRERHFVSQNQKEVVFAEVLDTLKKNTLAYLSHPDFAEKIILSKYRDLKKKKPQFFLQ